MLDGGCAQRLAENRPGRRNGSLSRTRNSYQSQLWIGPGNGRNWPLSRVWIVSDYGGCDFAAEAIRHGINSSMRLMVWPSAILVRMSLR